MMQLQHVPPGRNRHGARKCSRSPIVRLQVSLTIVHLVPIGRRKKENGQQCRPYDIWWKLSIPIFGYEKKCKTKPPTRCVLLKKPPKTALFCKRQPFSCRGMGSPFTTSLTWHRWEMCKENWNVCLKTASLFERKKPLFFQVLVPYKFSKHPPWSPRNRGPTGDRWLLTLKHPTVNWPDWHRRNWHHPASRLDGGKPYHFMVFKKHISCELILVINI